MQKVILFPCTVFFKGPHKTPAFEDGIPPGSKVVMSTKSAYITSQIFVKSPISFQENLWKAY